MGVTIVIWPYTLLLFDGSTLQLISADVLICFLHRWNKTTLSELNSLEGESCTAQVITNTTWLSLRHLRRQSRAVSLDHTGEWWRTDRKRQSALSQGNLEEFRHRQLKIWRAKYYECKVEHLEERLSSNWWKEVKKLTGVSKPGTEDRKLRCGPRQGSG